MPAGTTLTALAWLVAPADAIRILLLRRTAPYVRPFIVDRELRVATVGTAAVVLALGLTVVAPLWLLALGPVVWGIPHLVGDVRYLVVRPGYHLRRSLVLVALPIAAAGLGAGAAAGALGAVTAALVARASRLRRGVAAMVALSLVIAMFALGPYADVVFAHIHNFVAVACWLLWRRRRGVAHLAVLASFVLATGLLATGALDRTILAAGALDWAPAGLSLETHFWQLAPGTRGAFAVRLVLVFAFAQAVHYAIWTRLVPEEDRIRATPRTYRASVRALERDFGRWLLLGTVALASALGIWAFLDLTAARQGYLRAALFHGHLELSALMLLALEGGLPWRRGSSPSS